MPTLQQIRLTPLNQVLISRKPILYTYGGELEGLGILRLDNSTFWVHDIAHQVGVVVSDFNIAEEVLKELARDF